MFLRLLMVFIWLAAPLRADGPLVVFAAASLAGPLDAVAETWEGEVVISYAGSATLARQVEAGAPVDIAIVANEAWMDHLAATGAVQDQTIRQILGNTLVLARAGGHARTGDLAEALLALPPYARIATGFTEAVPVGIYARQTLASLEIWDRMEPQLVQVENARLSLVLVARGDVAAAMIYRSDAMAEPRVSEVAAASSDLHDPVRYMAAATMAGAHPDAATFLDHLTAPSAQAIFSAAGFLPVP